MNLLFHERIKREQYKDRLAEAAHWRFANQIKQNQKEEKQSLLVSILLQVLEVGRTWLSVVTFLSQSSKGRIN
jgi:hypothetical protein